MHTLEQLRSARLKGITRLTLSENLTQFPLEILDLADSLEILDLSHNQLSELPIELAQLKKLKIAFFSDNLFTSVPKVFKELEHLYMLGFKANQIEHFEEDILPLTISWLILTDNKIKRLPHSIGKLHRLRKCALAGNDIRELPDTMQACQELELLRLSANSLTHIPQWLLHLPKLSWLAFSGNPCSQNQHAKLETISFDSLELKERLGEGASGEIFKAFSPHFEKEIALKLFKGAVTSDGYAKDEMHAYMSTGTHPHLIQVLAKIEEPSRLGLVLELIPNCYDNLGLPPNFETCTRDTFTTDKTMQIDDIEAIAKAMCSVGVHLHERGLMHGDFYAHNILINEDGHSYLGDFGAASFYDKTNVQYEKIEVRAFGCLIDDLLQLCPNKNDVRYEALKNLALTCMQPNVSSRVLFKEMTLF